MLKALSNYIFGNTTTKYTKKRSGYNITYQLRNNVLEREISIKKDKVPILSYDIDASILTIGDVNYELTKDHKLICLKYHSKVLYYNRTGGNLNTSFENVTYKDGNIMSANYNDRLYRRVESSDLPLYLMYTSDGIYGYLQGIIINIVTGRSKYALISNGYILGYMNALDTNVAVQWKNNIYDILFQIQGYNPCNKNNLLPEHYFDDSMWLLLKQEQIIIPYNERLVLYNGMIPRHFVNKSIYILYDSFGSVADIFGYQPLLSVKNGNLHGLISLTSEYYYHHGILQWRRDGNIYLVRYTDIQPIKLTIYSDRVIYMDKSYIFNQGLTSIHEDIHATILYNNGIPLITTYGKIRNLTPDF